MKGKYLVQSHADYTQTPLGSVFHYQVFDETGLQVGHFTGSPASAVQFAAVESLEAISPAKLGAIWREHWTDFGEIDRAQEELDAVRLERERAPEQEAGFLTMARFGDRVARAFSGGKQ